MTPHKRTPLYDVQQARGARFVAFAGWEMAVQFQGLKPEHHAVRQRAGLFDVSHMGEFNVIGPGALDALQMALTRDVSKLSPGRAQYTLMCREEGGIIDDLIVYCVNRQHYFLVVNASRCQVDAMHLQKILSPFDCQLHNVSDQYALLALQGPKALSICTQLTDAAVSSMGPFDFVDAAMGGIASVRIARTGYTGEPGVELYVAAHEAETLWCAIEDAGKEVDLALCGLGARDTLRLEMKYPLYGNDLDEDHNPLEAGLGWVVAFDKDDFVGKRALMAVKKERIQRKWVGFCMQDNRIPRKGYPIMVDGIAKGKVTSGTLSPSLGVPIGVGYVPMSHAAPGSLIEIDVRGQLIGAEVIQTPFYKGVQP